MCGRTFGFLEKLFEILFVQKYFMLFVGKALVIFVEPFLAFRNRHVVVVTTGRFHIKEVRPLAGLYFLRINLVTAIVLLVFHRV